MGLRAVRQLLSGMLSITVALTALPAPAASAQTSRSYYKTAYSDVVFVVDDGGHAAPLSLPEWESAGFPRPLPSPTEYVKYAWSPTVYAVTYWPGGWMWDALDAAAWHRAGHPEPRLAGFIEGTEYYRWRSSDEVFAFTPRDGVRHKLTPAEWRDSGFRPPDRLNKGFYGLSWLVDEDIAFVDYDAEISSYVTFDDWRAQDFPTPGAVQRQFGDLFYAIQDSRDIFYSGAVESGYLLTLDQWIAAGRPEPLRYR